MITLAIVGTGRMGTYHARLAAKHPNISIVAYVTPSMPSDELLALAPDAVHATTLDQVLDHVDAVIIASPTPTHYTIARTALMAGKDVLVEKPITVDYAQAEDLFVLADAHDCVLHVGHVEQYNPAFVAARTAVSDSVQLIRTTRSGPYHPRVGGDSVVLDLMIHDIDLILRLTGSAPTSITAVGRSHVSTQPDTALAHLTFANGTLATVTVHRGAATGTREMVIEDNAHTLHADFGTRILTQKNGHLTTFEPPADANPLNDQLNAFVAAITTGTHKRNAVHDLLALRTTLHIAQAVAPSAGREEKYPSTTTAAK